MKTPETKLEELRHKNKMTEIKEKRKAHLEVENLRFDYAMQLQRIKTAEIKRAIDRRENKKFMEGYHK